MHKKKIRKMIEEAGEDRVIQDKLMDLICEVMEMLEEKDPEEYKEIEKKMYDEGMMRGLDSGFDKDFAEFIVDKIYQNNHMNKSERLFTYQKAEQLAKQHNIPMEDFTLEDWYITLVMAESDFKELLGTNLDNYVTYAKLWLMDKDAPDGGSCKLYDYLVYVAQIIDDKDQEKYGRSDNGYGQGTYGYMTNRNGMYGRYNGMYSYPYSNGMMNRGRMNMGGYDMDDGEMYDMNDGRYDNNRGYDNGHDRYDNARGYDNGMDMRYDNARGRGSRGQSSSTQRRDYSRDSMGRFTSRRR